MRRVVTRPWRILRLFLGRECDFEELCEFKLLFWILTLTWMVDSMKAETIEYTIRHSCLLDDVCA